MAFEGEQFLHKRNPRLHTTQFVEHEQDRRENAHEGMHQKPHERLADWMQTLEHTHLAHRGDPKVVERLRKHYHGQYVIRPAEVSERYIEARLRSGYEKGQGDDVTQEELRTQTVEDAITNQRITLDVWFDYLMSLEGDYIPMWMKYWIFTEIAKLSGYDRIQQTFRRRDRGTLAPFPELDEEALGLLVDRINSQVGKVHVADKTIDTSHIETLENMSFSKLYAEAIESTKSEYAYDIECTDGLWVRYPQASNHDSLVQSLKGHDTGWCTARESTAATQLKGGDFYVYYSNDIGGKPIIPRAAIRMSGDQIAEVRGIALEQNLDPYIHEVVEQKLNEFPDGELYDQKLNDMALLTQLEHKRAQQEMLSIEELRFLYQVDRQIIGFGRIEDPRIAAIIQRGDIKNDMARIFDCTEEEISTTVEEVLSGKARFHYGHLDLDSRTTTDELTLPEFVSGHLYLNEVTSLHGVTLPKHVAGGLHLAGVVSLEGVELPTVVYGDLDLRKLTTMAGTKLPATLNGSIFLNSLVTAEGLNFPEAMRGSIHLGSLMDAAGLALPQSVGGDIDLHNVEVVSGLVLPKIVGKDVLLHHLHSLKGVALPETVIGDLYLSGVTSLEGVVLPRYVGGEVVMGGLSQEQRTELRTQYPHLHVYPE